MTMFCLPDDSDKYARLHLGYHPSIKMEQDSGDEDQLPRSPSIPIDGIITANENWRGKNDPAERRRIQNRLNQRAFRQRQRAGESPKQYKPRSVSSASKQQDSDDEGDSPQSESSAATSGSYIEGRAASAPASANTPSGVTDTDTGRVWDELAQLINRNFLSGAVTNAQHVGIDLIALQAGTAVRTPRPGDRPIPAPLAPVELQHQIPHDPIIDIIPHARLRFNIIRAIAAGQIDAVAFSKSIRASGALEDCNGSWQRGGVVVWSFPEQVGNWELSEPFVRKWAALLQGCEDLIAATNEWRNRRGERLFPTSFNRTQASTASS